MTSTIHSACSQGDLETVRQFVASDTTLVNADDQHGWRPIFHAALERHAEVVQFLIEYGADLGAHDGYVLHYAGEVPGNKEIVGMLLKYGALDAHVRPVDDLSRQFLSAVFLGDARRVAAMLEQIPELANTVDGRGDLPIHHAARNGDTDVVETLIRCHADVNAANDRGHTVLYCAGGHAHAETVALLLRHGVDVDKKFTDDGKDLRQWLQQYPDDSRFDKIVALLDDHQSDGSTRQSP
ncbi:ankyrin repeat domain-containing protein [Planctomycetes bacterium K23_9]|uniref:Ankyrin repeats (3 copies) n=1 Tax=Stieleria marina TaxID=1930275 RepID=A0A517P2A1_9BACT|nr:Ankyrin repeats (3 copies) [Planctomycetes bacterium K23_9]